MVQQFEIGVAQIVVNRFGHPSGYQVEPALEGKLAELVGCVLRIVAADVKKIADIVGPEDFDDPLVVKVLPLLELVPASADTAGCRRGPQESDFILRRG